MIDVNSIGASANSSVFSGRAKAQQNIFLEILSTELSNQNPLDPIKNEDWIAQLAQFESLEQTTNLNTQMSLFNSMFSFMQGSSLIGKEVTYLNELGQEVKGTVESVSKSGTNVLLKIDGQEVSVNQIKSISEKQE